MLGLGQPMQGSSAMVFFHRENTLTERIMHKALLEELSKRKQAGEKNLAIRRKKTIRLDHKWIWASPIEIASKVEFKRHCSFLTHSITTISVNMMTST